jgi:hypothetical protein
VFQHLPSFFICGSHKNADTLNMSNKDVEFKTAQVDQAVNAMATAVLNFSNSAFLFPLNAETSAYYMPVETGRARFIDLLEVLTFEREYGLAKAKAILKPWISDSIHYFDFDAIGFFHDLGKISLFSFNMVDLKNISPNQLVVYKDDYQNIILRRSAA